MEEYLPLLRDGNPINSLTILEELSAMVRAMTVIIFAMSLVTTDIPPGICQANVISSLYAIGLNIMTAFAIALLRFKYVTSMKIPVRSNDWSIANIAMNTAILAIVTISVVLYYIQPLPNGLMDTICVGVGWNMGEVISDYRGYLTVLISTIEYKK